MRPHARIFKSAAKLPDRDARESRIPCLADRSKRYFSPNQACHAHSRTRRVPSLCSNMGGVRPTELKPIYRRSPKMRHTRAHCGLNAPLPLITSLTDRDSDIRGKSTFQKCCSRHRMVIPKLHPFPSRRHVEPCRPLARPRQSQALD